MPRVFLLSDPHLGKDMAPFGAHWVDHPGRIRAALDEMVSPADVVLVPGDISWGKHFDRSMVDLRWLDERPGRCKVMVKGNHDWWWISTDRVREQLPESLIALDSDAVRVPVGEAGHGVIVAGCKGYLSPGDPYFKPADEKAHRKNMKRAKAAVEAARELHDHHPEDPVVFCFHYPPFASDGEPTEYSELIEAADFISHCVFGHFHFEREWAVCPQGDINGVQYFLGSADYLGFRPLELFALGD